MRITLIQFSSTADIQKNKSAVLDYLEQSASRGADLVMTPEVCLSPFFPQHPGRDVSRYEICIDDDVVGEWRAACG